MIDGTVLAAVNHDGVPAFCRPAPISCGGSMRSSVGLMTGRCSTWRHADRRDPSRAIAHARSAPCARPFCRLWPARRYGYSLDQSLKAAPITDVEDAFQVRAVAIHKDQSAKHACKIVSLTRLRVRTPALSTHVAAARPPAVLGMRAEAIDLLPALNTGHAATTARLWSMSRSTSAATTPLAMAVTMSSSLIAPAPDRTSPRCSRAITTMASIVPCAPSAAGPTSRRLSDEEAIVSTPSMNTAGRHAFAPPHVRPRIESAPARGAAPVHVVARAGENRRAITGLIVLAPLRGGLGGGHITPGRVLQGNRGRDSSTRVQSMVYGRQVFLEHTKISCGNSFVSRGLQPSPCQPRTARGGCSHARETTQVSQRQAHGRRIRGPLTEMIAIALAASAAHRSGRGEAHERLGDAMSVRDEAKALQDIDRETAHLEATRVSIARDGLPEDRRSEPRDYLHSSGAQHSDGHSWVALRPSPLD